ncbi:hypothetical protein H1C71_032876, partial [Ictidomys tridecemlineatus]
EKAPVALHSFLGHIFTEHLLCARPGPSPADIDHGGAHVLAEGDRGGFKRRSQSARTGMFRKQSGRPERTRGGRRLDLRSVSGKGFGRRQHWTLTEDGREVAVDPGGGMDARH